MPWTSMRTLTSLYWWSKQQWLTRVPSDILWHHLLHSKELTFLGGIDMKVMDALRFVSNIGCYFHIIF